MLYLSLLLISWDRFLPSVYDGYLYLMLKAKGFPDVTFIYVKGNDFLKKDSCLSKGKAINVLRKTDWIEKMDHYKT